MSFMIWCGRWSTSSADHERCSEFWLISRPETATPPALAAFDPSVAIHTDSRDETYRLGICTIKTSLGHLVECYDTERTLCDIIKNSRKIDAEIYGKALRLYAKSKHKNTRNLLHYAQILKIENKVAELMTVVLNED